MDVDIVKLGVILAATVLLLAICLLSHADGVKYCKDARTGDIIVVEEGQPCPYPTHEI